MDRNVTYTDRVGVYAIIQKGRSILLTEQADPGPEIQLPGGGIDPGESPLAALHREVFEETGWRIAAPRRLGAYKRYAYMPEYDLWARKICIIYSVQAVRALGPPREEGHRALWTDAVTAPDLLANSGDRAFFINYVLGYPAGV
ncbi:MAG: NUDIX hydrolase [Pseudomonadota bacterium]